MLNYDDFRDVKVLKITNKQKNVLLVLLFAVMCTKYIFAQLCNSLFSVSHIIFKIRTLIPYFATRQHCKQSRRIGHLNSTIDTIFMTSAAGVQKLSEWQRTLLDILHLHLNTEIDIFQSSLVCELLIFKFFPTFGSACIHAF